MKLSVGEAREMRTLLANLEDVTGLRKVTRVDVIRALLWLAMDSRDVRAHLVRTLLERAGAPHDQARAVGELGASRMEPGGPPRSELELELEALRALNHALQHDAQETDQP